MKQSLIFLLIIFTVAVSFLFSPPPDAIGPNSYCPHQYVRLNKYMGIPVNCDEFTFIGAAVRPAYLTEQDFQRQNRPGYVLLGTAIGYSIYFVLTPLHDQIKSIAQQHLTGQFSQAELDKAVLYGSVYCGYIIINIIILFLALMLFNKALVLISGAWKNSSWLLWCCLGFFLSNQVTKLFFWTAHQQMFTLFTPIASIYAGLVISKHSNPGKISLIMSAVCGVLLLVYGNFILLLPVIALTYWGRQKELNKLFAPATIYTSLLIAICFVLPTFSWIAYLRFHGVIYYNHEIVQFRHFVWMADALKNSFGFLLNEIYSNNIKFFKTMGSIILSLIFLLVVLGYRWYLRNKYDQLSKQKFPFVINKSILLTFCTFLVFLWLIGAYADRLTFSFAPIIIFVAVQYINERKLGKNIQWLLAGLILLLHLYTIAFNAPHLSEELFFQ